MSLKKIAEKVLPEKLVKKIKKSRGEAYTKKLLSDWEKKGRPAPVPHIVKQLAIKEFAKHYAASILVETGTYKGDMVDAQKDFFKQIISIELGDDLHKAAVKRFEKLPHIKILLGNSGDVLHKVVPELKDRALFFLDGHYSAGITAKGNLNCPIYGELDAIFNNNKKHVILIDDARCFVGEKDYPTIQALTDYVNAKDPSYKIEVKDDIIRVYPAK